MQGETTKETRFEVDYYYWADAKMSKASYLLGVVGGVLGVLGSVLT